VKNVDPDVTQDEFMKLFEPYGTVTSARIQLDDKGRSKGFGFVNYENHEEALMAVEKLHDTDLKGMKLFVSRAQKKAEREVELRRSCEHTKMDKHQGVNIYIKNLEDDVDDETLRADFEPFGTVTSCKVMCSKDGTSKGFGFVCFASPAEATAAITEMNNKLVRTKPLYVAFAQPRDVRRQQLEGQIAQRDQSRMQQAAADPAFHPPPGLEGFPPQGGHGMPSYGQPIMMPPPPRYPPNSGQSMPVSMPYGQAPPQGYGMPLSFPRGAVLHHPHGPGGPGSFPINLDAVMQFVNGALLPNGIAPWPGPLQAPNVFILLVPPHSRWEEFGGGANTFAILP
jgi:polyadenylate-binding protein